jgi:hypothetical protein
MPQRTRRRILVAGLGNLLLADDGVGIHAARALLGSRPRGVATAPYSFSSAMVAPAPPSFCGAG